MLFQAPNLGAGEHNAIARIDDLYKKLAHALRRPERWSGVLRRLAMARAIQASSAIEGHHVSVEDAAAAVGNEDPMDAAREDWLAVQGYQTAMTYALQQFEDPYFDYDETLIRSLHFMLLSHNLSTHPGQWRTKPISVRRIDTAEVVYGGPDADQVPELMRELVRYLRIEVKEPPFVTAALAHLNLTMIHPFEDGNGRMARILQSLVLIRSGISSPVFSSIEEWLGRNTEGYYEVLGEVGAGDWHPERDARPWIRFCLKAHFDCATAFLRRNNKLGRMWTEVQRIIEDNKLQDRADIALLWAALGYKVRNSTYRGMADITDFVASRDLKKMTDKGLLAARGVTRGRYYVATKQLLDVEKRARAKEIKQDPFEAYQTTLNGMV